MAVLRAYARGRAVRAAEYNRAAHLTARHIKRLSGRIDNMINGLHGKVKCHELDNWTKSAHCCADTDTCKPIFGNGRINHALIAKFLEQFAGDFISALIFGNFFAHDEDGFVAAHFFGHGITKRVAHSHVCHFDVGRNVGIIWNCFSHWRGCGSRSSSSGRWSGGGWCCGLSRRGKVRGALAVL